MNRDLETGAIPYSASSSPSVEACIRHKEQQRSDVRRNRVAESDPKKPQGSHPRSAGNVKPPDENGHWR